MMMDDSAVEAWIARGRMREMMARGWRAKGPIREDAVLMTGPDPDDDAAEMRDLGQAAIGLAVVQRARAIHARGLERLGAKSRHVA